MEAWRDELYHGVLDGLRGRIKNITGTSSGIGRKGNGLGTGPVGTGSGRTWKEHKYIRKEGNRYIYPEDLQKSSKSKKKEYKELLKNTSREDKKLLRGTNLNRLNKTYYKSGSTGIKANITAGRLERNLKKAQKGNQITIGKYRGTNTVRGSISKDRDVYTLEETTQFTNGKTWFDTVDVKQYYSVQDVGGYGGINKAYTTRNEYTVSYGKIHQAYNEGKDWVRNKLGIRDRG